MSNQKSSNLTSKLTSICLLVAFAGGIAINHWQIPALARFLTLIEPIGVIWTNALRMTIIPLIVSSLVIGISSIRDQKMMGRLGGLSMITFIGMIILGLSFSTMISTWFVRTIRIDPATVAAIRSMPAEGSKKYLNESKLPDLRESLVNIVPSNPFKSAVDGDILPLIVFTAIFGLALNRVENDRRQLMLKFFYALSDVSTKMIGWVLKFMPLGVLALILPMASKLGLSIVGVLGYYITLVTSVLILFIGLLYLIALFVGKLPLRIFASALAPAQAVALSSRSSIASLPALIEGAQKSLPYPHVVSSFVLSLATSTFKVNRSVSPIARLFFFSCVYGIKINAVTLSVFAITIVAQCFSTPGIPSAGAGSLLPVFLALGVPAEGYFLTKTVEPIIDLSITVCNVTGSMTALTIVSRIAGVEEEEESTKQTK